MIRIILVLFLVFSLRGEEGLRDHEGDVLTDGIFIAKQGLQTSVNMACKCFYFMWIRKRNGRIRWGRL